MNVPPSLGGITGADRKAAPLDTLLLQDMQRGGGLCQMDFSRESAVYWQVAETPVSLYQLRPLSLFARTV